MRPSQDRHLDVVLLGATGFTGALTAEYLAAHAPAGLRWAIAGRDGAKLEALRHRLGADVEMLVVDVSDPACVRAAAESTRILVTTVGPYLEHGEPVVAACAAAGTDYLDLTGETEFVDRTYVRHHAEAVKSGARIVHACGFESVPHDLGAWFTVQQLPEDAPIRLRGYVSATGLPSGGTFATAVLAMSRAKEAAAARAERRRADPGDPARRVRAVGGRPGYEPSIGRWVLPAPTIDPIIVTASAWALDRYGPDFSYTHYFAFSNPAAAAGLAVGVGGMAALAQLPVTRDLLPRLWPSGAGPTRRQRAAARFRIRFLGEGGGKRVRTEVAGGDPGYGETSKMLAEASLCMARDTLTETAGQVTTAVAMGDALRVRLQRAGITFRVVKSSETRES